MKKLFYPVMFLLLSSSLFAQAKIDTLEYGFIIGSCAQYCYKYVKIADNYLKYVDTIRGDSLQSVPCFEESPNYYLKLYSRKIKHKEFTQVPENTGCPYCNDSGLEYLQIKYNNGKIHRVEYEYYREPKGMENYLGDLRKMLLDAMICFHPAEDY